ncbi:hypothetical protein GGR54DRAFT_176744 [Hypoxylon sp. NC1633]|nr:hypothetical protein GGR54DRAFT_176744 [Hypoxylon sp. NC1633]
MDELQASTLGTAATILLGYLKKACNSVERLNDIPNPEPEGITLLEQVKDLFAVTESIDDIATKKRRYSSARSNAPSATDLVHLPLVFRSASEVTQKCIGYVEILHSAVEEMIRERDKTGFLIPERLATQPWYEDMHGVLKLHTEVLQMLFSSIVVLQSKNRSSDDGNLSAEASDSASTLQYQTVMIESMLRSAGKLGTDELRKALTTAKAVTLQAPTSLNKHFAVKRSARSFYTGREKQMAKLDAAFKDTGSIGQKRFVIYGLGGSGKTELALKYAEDHLRDFWGVFYVDASSRKNASKSYWEIAKIGGVEPNEKAAKNWLATRVLPWLLIIDNADDDEVLLDEVLPTGTRGCILVTSRNPAHTSYGTVGERHLELLPMETEEANDLILKVAEEPIPWTKALTESASAVCSALGFLPLALVHAGKAILRDLCSWSGFLAYYDREADRIRRERLQRDRSSSRHRRRAQEENDGMNVFTSFEMLFRPLEMSEDQEFQDAVELIQLFSYFHHQNIRIDILVNAAVNPLKEEKAREEEAKSDAEVRKRIPHPMKNTWSTWARELLIRIMRHLDSPPPLPAVLRNPDGLNATSFEHEVNDRLRLALAVLVQMSLVVKQDRDQDIRRYCMPPLVHKWVRERPGMVKAQQALWCQISATVLARNVLFPPLGDTEDERSMRRELLPHIIHVRNRQEAIRERLEESREARRSLWPVIRVEFGRHQALESARFSRVYSECGFFHEALNLQSKVRKFAIQALGEGHPLTVMITLFLSGTLYELSRVSEATRLLRRVYDVCMESLGEYHPLTLKVTDMLASSLCFLGQWNASLSLQQKAVKGLTQDYGEHDERTLKATCNLGRVHLRYMEFEKSSELHRVAWEGMKKKLGETHVETLICLEELAMSRIRLGEKHLPECHEMMTFVLDQREKILGKEQPYTLLAICNLGRVKSAMGQHEQAARIMKEAVEIAERNLGENHFGVLAGKTHYAQVLANQRRYKEAEEIFRTVEGKPQYEQSTEDEGGEHPDRLIALWYLTGCLEKQGRFQEALENCQGVIEALRKIGGRGLGTKHKFATMVQEEITRIKDLMQDEKAASNPDLTVPAEL